MLENIMTLPHPETTDAEAGLAPVRVLVADDHPLFRRGMASALGRHADIQIVAEAADGEEALHLIEQLEPDVAVLDFRMPGLSGAEVCRALTAGDNAPPTALLLLSAFEDAELVWSAVKAGAAGYLGKSASQEEIHAAVVRVGRGGIAYTPQAAAGFAEGFARHCMRTEAR